jgi:hypothetical protein
MDLSKCQESLSKPGHGVYILPLPVTSCYGKNAYLADYLRLNSNGKTAKSTSVRSDRWAGRTFHQDPADCPRVDHGPSARSTELHSILLRITDRPPGVRGLSAWKRIFSKTFAKKSQILNKYQKPADRPPKGLDCPPNTWKLIFLKNPFTKRNRHSSKYNTCKFLIQVTLWKVKPMKLIPLDSTSIYPINPVI